MTNGETCKTAKERAEEFREWCKNMDIAMDMARRALAKAGGESKEGETK